MVDPDIDSFTLVGWNEEDAFLAQLTQDRSDDSLLGIGCCVDKGLLLDFIFQEVDVQDSTPLPMLSLYCLRAKL
jgi:hypothetical protein